MLPPTHALPVFYHPTINQSIIPFQAQIHLSPIPSLRSTLSPSLPLSSRTVPPRTLDDHLSHSLPTQRLAAHEALSLDSGDGIERSSDREEDRRGNQARRGVDETEPLDDGHGQVDAGAHVVGGEAAHEGVEFR